MIKPKRVPSCHPDKKHYAKDLCANCYRKTEKMQLFYEMYSKSENRKKSIDNYSKSEKGREKQKLYRETHKHTFKQYQKDYHSTDKSKKYHLEYQRKRTKEDIQYKLSKTLRSRLGSAIKNNFKAGSFVSDLGCTIEFLKQHLESQFQEGMTWDNWGEWHIDHIIPLSSVNLTDREEFLKVCNYTNLQPLWAKDNLSKGNKLTYNKECGKI